MMSSDPARPHRVVVALLTQDGTRNAAAICTDMIRSFPNLRWLVMCGIAGGFPAPHDPERHVRLGDVVTSAQGVVDYDHVRTIDGRDHLRRSTDGLSKALLRADRELETRALNGRDPWLQLLRGMEAEAPAPFRRPAGHDQPPPRVHRAAIGSADRLLRDAARRDLLAERHGVRAVEMEGSGIAVGADLHGLHWYMVRGVADHCDGEKDDAWHGYASLVAAAYTRALLAEAPPFVVSANVPAAAGTVRGLEAIVEALLSLSVMDDDQQRRAVVGELPLSIRSSIPSHQVTRLHVISIVRTCERFDGGRDALIDALRVTTGAGPELDRVVSVIRSNWPVP